VALGFRSQGRGRFWSGDTHGQSSDLHRTARQAGRQRHHTGGLWAAVEWKLSCRCRPPEAARKAHAKQAMGQVYPPPWSSDKLTEKWLWAEFRFRNSFFSVLFTEHGFNCFLSKFLANFNKVLLFKLFQQKFV
jgi:hypothetical protein